MLKAVLSAFLAELEAVLAALLAEVFHDWCNVCGMLVQIVSVAQSAPAFQYDPSISKKRNPNKRRRWLIPLFIIAQVALKVGGSKLYLSGMT